MAICHHREGKHKDKDCLTLPTDKQSTIDRARLTDTRRYPEFLSLPPCTQGFQDWGKGRNPTHRYTCSISTEQEIPVLGEHIFMPQCPQPIHTGSGGTTSIFSRKTRALSLTQRRRTTTWHTLCPTMSLLFHKEKCKCRDQKIQSCYSLSILRLNDSLRQTWVGLVSEPRT